MKTGIKVTIAIVAIIIVILFARVYFTGNVVKEKDTIKLGVTIPLTGDLASFGTGEKDAMEIAAQEINSAGGINGKKLELVIEDTKCDAKEGISAANKLINIEKVSVIVGEVCSGSVLAMAPITEQSKTILFATAASSPKITNAGDYVFRDYPSDAYQGKFAAEYSYNKLGKRKVGLLYMQIDYGIGVKDAFKNRFKELGGQVVSEERGNGMKIFYYIAGGILVLVVLAFIVLKIKFGPNKSFVPTPQIHRVQSFRPSGGSSVSREIMAAEQKIREAQAQIDNLKKKQRLFESER